MNLNLKKRKKSAFNTYKAVRINISLNNQNKQVMEYAWQIAVVANNWENNYIEQVSELRSGINPINQTVIKQNKLITKWWENN